MKNVRDRLQSDAKTSRLSETLTDASCQLPTVGFADDPVVAVVDSSDHDPSSLLPTDLCPESESSGLTVEDLTAVVHGKTDDAQPSQNVQTLELTR